MILRDVADIGAKCGLTIQRPEVVESLRALVEAGLARAYDLFPGICDPFSGELQGMPPLDLVEHDFRTCFYVTKHGIDLHKADGTWWPLNDEGAVRPDRKPPES